MLTLKTTSLGILFLLVFLAVQNVRGQSTRCVNPNRNVGSCLSVYDCPSIIGVIQKIPLSDAERSFILNSQCQTGTGRAPFICCTADSGYTGANTPAAVTRAPTAATTPTRRPTPGNGQGDILPVPPQCGWKSLADKIYNGNDTAIDEYPWMALLEYVERTGKRSLNCGGSLINQRYVLTAAHCVIGQIETEIGRLATVRLGEYNITSEIDCIDGDCNNKVLEVDVEEQIPHPQYDPKNGNRHHDIALVRLSKDVTFTDFVRPVCLPMAESRMAITIGELLTVAGWGRTLLARQSDVKKQLGVPVNDHAACARQFSTRRVTLIESQLCAGGQFARDSCDGDSGGPLMREGFQNRIYLEGVVSFGNRCGLEGWPGVYTRTANYMDWIQQTIRP